MWETCYLINDEMGAYPTCPRRYMCHKDKLGQAEYGTLFYGWHRLKEESNTQSPEGNFSYPNKRQLAAKPDNLGLTPKIHVAAEQNGLLKAGP